MRLFAFSAFALLLVAAAPPIAAAEGDSTSLLDPVTVYATRSPRASFDVPAIISKIEVDRFGSVLSGDIGDLLEFMPGVDVGGGARRNGQVVSIRGFDDEAVITLIDGRRQNFISQHDGRFFIDPSLLKSVEVVKGASSAIYGGGGIGGVVAFETKDATDFLAPGETFGGQVSFGYRSANDNYVPTLTIYRRWGDLNFLGNLSFRTSGDIELGKGGTLISKDKIFSGVTKLGYTFLSFNTVKLEYQRSDRDSREPNTGSEIRRGENPLVNKDISNDQFSFKYVFENPDNSWLNLKLHFYYYNIEVKEEDIVGANAGRIQIREIDTFGFTIDNQTKLSFGDAHKHIFSYGFEFYNDEQNGKSNMTPMEFTAGSRGGVPDAENYNYGIYLQDEIAFDTPIGTFLLIPALRWDFYESEDKNNPTLSQSENELSPKISLSYKPVKNIAFFGSWAHAFRGPNLTETYASGQHFPRVDIPTGPPPAPALTIPQNVFIPNPDLRPETVNTVELGLKFSFNQLLFKNDQFQFEGAWFYSDGKDLITQIISLNIMPPGTPPALQGTTRFLNIPNATLMGFEVEGEYRWHPLTARVGLSYVEAEDDDTGLYLTNHNVPLTVVAEVSFAIDVIDSVIGWRTRYASESSKSCPFSSRAPGAPANPPCQNDDTPDSGAYDVHDIYIRWQPTAKYLDAFILDVGIENLFDEAYRKRFVPIREEGRSYVARLSYKW